LWHTSLDPKHATEKAGLQRQLQVWTSIFTKKHHADEDSDFWDSLFDNQFTTVWSYFQVLI
jgi:hypothetical protein